MSPWGGTYPGFGICEPNEILSAIIKPLNTKGPILRIYCKTSKQKIWTAKGMLVQSLWGGPCYLLGAT